MTIAIVVPHAKEPEGDPTAVLFADYMEAALVNRDIEFYTIMGDKSKTMIDLSTHNARGTSYNDELSSALKNSILMVELHSHDEDSADDYSEFDFIIEEFPEFSEENLSEELSNSLQEFGDANVENADASNRYASTLSTLIFGKPAIIFSVNENTKEKFIGSSEALVEFLVDYAARRKSSA